MLEKNSHVVLTDDELTLYNSGVVSERIKQSWNIETIDELRELIASNQTYNNSNSKVSTQ